MWRGWWARPNQLAPPGEWSTWVILSGRGFGKSRSGAEWVREKWKSGVSRIALVAETAADARDVIVEGPSGLLNISPKHERPIFEPTKRRLTWPNGATATLYNGTEPDQLRGPEHEAAWVDELAKYKYAQACWDNLQFGMRIGLHPQVCVTTTPRPIWTLRQILADEGTIVTKGSTYDNAANLSGNFLRVIRRKYEGTRLGRQELHAEMLDDLPGALWTVEMLEACHIDSVPCPLERVVVAIDPSGAGDDDDESDADEIGIVVAGLGRDGLVYVLADYSVKGSPDTWGQRAVRAYHNHQADRIIAETNFGGAMVKHVIRTVDDSVSYKDVKASRGKVARAEPVAALYEQNRVKHVGTFSIMEDQMLHFGPTGYVGKGSPDRADAAVWAVTELALEDFFHYGMLEVAH